MTDTVDGAGVDESFFLPNKFENMMMNDNYDASVLLFV